MSTLTVVLQAGAARRPRLRSRYARGRSTTLPSIRTRARTRAVRAPLGGVTLLVVEDHDDSREMLRQMLSALGARVLVAEQGAHALAILGREQPDLILLDLLMPVMDGFVFAQHAKRDHRLRDIPIIAVTALGEIQDYLRTWQEGLAGHLTKPVSEPDLVSVIERVILQRRRAPARGRKPLP